MLHFRTLVTCLIFETFGTPYPVLTHEFGLGRRHNNRSVATIFGVNKPTGTTKPVKHGRDIASKLFIFDTSNDKFTSGSEEQKSSKSKPIVVAEPRESLNERKERIRLQKLELQNHEFAFVDFDGSGVRARGGIWEERKK